MGRKREPWVIIEGHLEWGLPWRWDIVPCSVIWDHSWWVLGTGYMWCRNWTWVGCLWGKHLIYCIISPLPVEFYFYFSLLLFFYFHFFFFVFLATPGSVQGKLLKTVTTATIWEARSLSLSIYIHIYIFIYKVCFRKTWKNCNEAIFKLFSLNFFCGYRNNMVIIE